MALHTLASHVLNPESVCDTAKKIAAETSRVYQPLEGCKNRRFVDRHKELFKKISGLRKKGVRMVDIDAQLGKERGYSWVFYRRYKRALAALELEVK